MENINKRWRMTLAAGGIAMLLGAPAYAADASPWVEDINSAIRLIAGASKSAAESLRAGIEIKMQRAGIPIGAIRAIPACRRVSIFPARTMSPP